MYIAPQAIPPASSSTTLMVSAPSFKTNLCGGPGAGPLTTSFQPDGSEA